MLHAKIKTWSGKIYDVNELGNNKLMATEEIKSDSCEIRNTYILDVMSLSQNTNFKGKSRQDGKEIFESIAQILEIYSL